MLSFVVFTVDVCYAIGVGEVSPASHYERVGVIMKVKEFWVIKDTKNNVFIGPAWTIVEEEIVAMKFKTYKAANENVREHIMPEGWDKFEIQKFTYTTKLQDKKGVTVDDNKVRRRK